MCSIHDVYGREQDCCVSGGTKSSDSVSISFSRIALGVYRMGQVVKREKKFGCNFFFLDFIEVVRLFGSQISDEFSV